MQDDDAVHHPSPTVRPVRRSAADEPLERVADLEREVTELREANAVLKAVSTFLAAAPHREEPTENIDQDQ